MLLTVSYRGRYWHVSERLSGEVQEERAMLRTRFCWPQLAALLLAAGVLIQLSIAEETPSSGKSANQAVPATNPFGDSPAAQVSAVSTPSAGTVTAADGPAAALDEPAPAAAVSSGNVEMKIEPEGPATATVEAAPDSTGGSPAELPVEDAPLEPAATAEAATESLAPIPDAQQDGGVKIEAAGFNGITPGVSKLADVEKAWGKPARQGTLGGRVVHLHSVPPFNQIEVSYAGDKVASIVIRLEKTFAATDVAQQLQLSQIRPVFVSNALGEILGQSYPERGVLFSFAPSKDPTKVRNEVAQIILEPISAEPFVLRAETNLLRRVDLSISDLEVALKLDPSNGRAHWLHARALAAKGEHGSALAAATSAVELEPGDALFRVTRAQCLGQTGAIAEAINEAQKAVQASNSRPHVKARAQCLLGDLYSSGLQPDYRQAFAYHSDAIKSADALTADQHPAIRVAAKEVMLDAYLGAAHDIAWGRWNHRETAVPRWLERASQQAHDLSTNERSGGEHQFRVASRALASHVGLQGKVDPGEWTDRAATLGQELIDAAEDTARKRQLQWELGAALYDAVQVYQMRGEHAKALEYGEKAVASLEAGIDASRADSDAAYLLGRLYFRLGAIHAIGKGDHSTAVTWFDKAVPVLKQAAGEAKAADSARLGETFVSMGVSYWESNQRDLAVSLTKQGVELMQQAVKDGFLQSASLQVPYGNLATMNRQLGNTDEASKYLQQAAQLKETSLK